MHGAASVDELLRAAESETGLTDWGDDWFRQPLAAWVEDLRSEHLNDTGRRFFTKLAVRDLSRRLRVVDTLARHPEIDDVRIPPIVYITGTIRSGTTLLHNAMARHERAKTLLRWELMEPVPPPERATAATDPRIADVQASIDRRRGTDIEAMHWVNADEPEECQWGFIDFVSLLGAAAGGCMHRWYDFIVAADHTQVFANYRRIVKLLLWKNPAPERGFLVLKAPQIADHPQQFAAVFPEARFVVTARDPYRVYASGRAMLSGIIDAFVTDDFAVPDPLPIERLEQTLSCLLDFEATSPELVSVVGYPRLVADPASVAQDVYRALGVPDDAQLGTKVEALLEGQRQGARARPPANLPEPGLGHDQVLARPIVAAFCARFGVEPERARLTGAHP